MITEILLLSLPNTASCLSFIFQNREHQMLRNNCLKPEKVLDEQLNLKRISRRDQHILNQYVYPASAT